MDQFPQELIDQICANLDNTEDLRNAYYVSIKFRKAAEEHVGNCRTRTHDLTPENKQDFIAFYSNFRLRYLKHVKFHIQFPDLDGAGESVDERRKKDKIFTAQIQDLFATLKVVEENAGERNRGKYQLTLCGPAQRRSKVCHDHWPTRLLEPDTLPHLMSVVSFEIDGRDQPGYTIAQLDYRVLIDFIPRLPRLEELVCHIGANWEFGGPLRDTRHDFGEAITLAKISQSLDRIELDFFYHDDGADSIHQWAAMPNLVSPASKDPFSTGLRILSYHLRTITLRAQLDETLFWLEDSSSEIPIWPNLVGIFIKLHIVSPSGAWYFEGPSGEGRGLTGYQINESSYPPLTATEEDDKDESLNQTNSTYFRILPNESLLDPFLKSFAKATAKMPNLAQAMIWLPLRWDVDGSDEDYELFEYFDSDGLSDYQYENRNSLAWGFAYNSPGSPVFHTNPGENNCAARQIWWHVGEWRPNPETHALFQKIGCEKHGEALKEYWDSDEPGHGLVARRFFGFWT